ncbi:MAG TPA: hypothetical protein VFM98_13125, partial [Ramlibacter sp.]|uniref:hypothetical protein n=1 Tax=Ramlibacter sp. TaxID=1917967 RepID=UPI002D7E5D4B
MAVSWQKGSLFAAGVALGIAAGAGGVMAWLGSSGAGSPLATRSMGAASATTSASMAAAAGECRQAPILGSTGSEDGQASLQREPAGASEAEVASLLLEGKEAAAAGRQRDAEITFLNACRNAALLPGDGMPLADAMYQLARHYATVAAFGGQPARELFGRAERLYSASLLAYTARYGLAHEKTRFAQEGLKTVQQATGRSGPVVAQATPVPAPAPAPAAALPPAAAPAAAASAPAPVAAASAP